MGKAVRGSDRVSFNTTDFWSPDGGAEDIVSPAGLAKTSLYPAEQQ
jgi:hypothetical protein